MKEIPFLAKRRLKRFLSSIVSLKPDSRLPRAGKAKILIFAPEAGVNPHFHMMCLVGRTLQDLGHDVWMARCKSQLDRCPVMGAARAPFELDNASKKTICARCSSVFFEAVTRYGLRYFDLSAYETSKLSETYKSAVQKLPVGVANLTFDGFNFGDLAAFETSVALKQTELDEQNSITSHAWSKVAKSALKSYLIVKQVLEDVPFTHIAYYNDYSIQLGAGLAAKKLGVTRRLISQSSNRNTDRRRCVVYPDCTAKEHYWIQSRWPEWKNVPLDARSVKEVAEDLLFRFEGRGSHIYSPAKTGASVLPEKNDQGSRKYRVLVFTSSPDELTSAMRSLSTLGVSIPDIRTTFPADIKHIHTVWLTALMATLGGRQDLQIVVRVHPREGANHREDNASTHLEVLRRTLKTIPNNFHVVWPEDKVSSYDLGELADLVLTSWSTIGLEMARLATPVIACTQGISGAVVDTFQTFVENPADYFKLLDESLGRTLSFETLVKSYRWWNLFCLGNTIDFGDVVPEADFTGLAPFKRSSSAHSLEKVFVGDTSVFDLNLNLLKNNPACSSHVEKLEIKKQCRRLLYRLIFGKIPATDYVLHYIDTSDKQPVGLGPKTIRSQDMTVLNNDGILTVHWGQEIITRFSPMAARLGFHGANSTISLK